MDLSNDNERNIEKLINPVVIKLFRGVSALPSMCEIAACSRPWTFLVATVLHWMTLSVHKRVVSLSARKLLLHAIAKQVEQEVWALMKKRTIPFGSKNMLLLRISISTGSKNMQTCGSLVTPARRISLSLQICKWEPSSES